MNVRSSYIEVEFSTNEEENTMVRHNVWNSGKSFPQGSDHGLIVRMELSDGYIDHSAPKVEHARSMGGALSELCSNGGEPSTIRQITTVNYRLGQS